MTDAALKDRQFNLHIERDGWTRGKDGIWPIFFYDNNTNIIVTKLAHRSWSWSVKYGSRGLSSSERAAKCTALTYAGIAKGRKL